MHDAPAYIFIGAHYPSVILAPTPTVTRIQLPDQSKLLVKAHQVHVRTELHFSQTTKPWARGRHTPSSHFNYAGRGVPSLGQGLAPGASYRINETVPKSTPAASQTRGPNPPKQRAVPVAVPADDVRSGARNAALRGRAAAAGREQRKMRPALKQGRREVVGSRPAVKGGGGGGAAWRAIPELRMRRWRSREYGRRGAAEPIEEAEAARWGGGGGKQEARRAAELRRCERVWTKTEVKSWQSWCGSFVGEEQNAGRLIVLYYIPNGRCRLHVSRKIHTHSWESGDLAFNLFSKYYNYSFLNLRWKVKRLEKEARDVISSSQQVWGTIKKILNFILHLKKILECVIFNTICLYFG